MTESSDRARTEGERGWVLLSVLVIAALYFALITLILVESTMRYHAAQRFRSRVVAQALAESAAELSARGLADGRSGRIETEIDDGILVGESSVTGNSGNGTFHITGAGESSGTMKADATVEVWGRLEGGRVIIDRTLHSQ